VHDNLALAGSGQLLHGRGFTAPAHNSAKARGWPPSPYYFAMRPDHFDARSPKNLEIIPKNGYEICVPSNQKIDSL
jgi:hypothetical protein